MDDFKISLMMQALLVTAFVGLAFGMIVDIIFKLICAVKPGLITSLVCAVCLLGMISILSFSNPDLSEETQSKLKILPLKVESESKVAYNPYRETYSFSFINSKGEVEDVELYKDKVVFSEETESVVEIVAVRYASDLLNSFTLFPLPKTTYVINEDDVLVVE